MPRVDELRIEHRTALSGSPRNGGSPSKQEKVAPAKGAPIGEKDQMQNLLQSIPGSYPSELDRSAMRTTYGKHTHLQLLQSARSMVEAVRPDLSRNAGVDLRR